MAFNPAMRHGVSAAGQKDQSGVLSELHHLEKVVELQTYFRMSASDWTTARLYGVVGKELGATVTVPIEPRVETYDYQLNQTIEIDQPEFEKRSITFNQARYFNVKVDKLQLEDKNVMAYLDNLTDRASRPLAEKMDPFAISTAISAILPYNRGKNAGRDRNIDLGTTAQPLQINGSNIIQLIVNASLTMKMTPRGSEWEPGKMFILMPSTADFAFMNSPFASICCENKNNSLITGKTLPNIAGFDIIFYDTPDVRQRDGNKYSYPILFGNKDAVAFHQATADLEFNIMDSRHFGRFFRGLMIYGAGVIQPKQLGLAIAEFSA